MAQYVIWSASWEQWLSQYVRIDANWVNFHSINSILGLCSNLSNWVELTLLSTSFSPCTFWQFSTTLKTNFRISFRRTWFRQYHSIFIHHTEYLYITQSRDAATLWTICYKMLRVCFPLSLLLFVTLNYRSFAQRNHSLFSAMKWSRTIIS